MPKAEEKGGILSFREFVDLVKPKYQWYRHCEILADVLQKVADGELSRVMIFMPPRHGKSELASRLFTAYYLYRYPERWVGVNSYAADLAYTLSRAARENYKAAGGVTKGDADAVKHWETLAGGGLWAAGVGGPITGKGFHLGLIDDPIKNSEEAASETIREKHKDWYGSTFYTREEPGGSIVVIQTRWHEDDLSGWLISQESEEDEPERWHIVNFEAVKEEEREEALEPEFPPTCTVEADWREPGEPLCPERYPLEKLFKIARRIGAYFWAALFQQRPQPREGNLIKVGMIRHADISPDSADRKLLRVYQAWDLAISENETADYTVCATVGVDGEQNIYLLHVLRDRLSFDETMKAMGEQAKVWKPATIAIETVGYQASAFQTAKKRYLLPFREVKPTRGEDKVLRAQLFADRVALGGVYANKRAAWWTEFEREALAFPSGKHDDQVDAVAYALKLHPMNFEEMAKSIKPPYFSPAAVEEEEEEAEALRAMSALNV